LAKALQDANLQFDYIILDCPPFLGAVTLNALMASDLLLMPTQAEFFSINALRNMMGLVRRIRSQGNARLTYRLLITMFDRRNRIHRTLSEQLRATFGVGVLDTVIETDTKLRESPIAGLPIIFHAPKSRASMQYRALAQEILTYVKETTAQPT
jgi:chromosome partitioning protein